MEEILVEISAEKIENLYTIISCTIRTISFNLVRYYRAEFVRNIDK